MEKEVLRALLISTLFENLSEQEVLKLMEGVEYKLVSYNRKEVYAHVGQPIEHVDMVVSGQLNRKLVNKSGRSVTAGSYNIGQCTGLSIIFSKSGNWPVMVEASRPTVVLRMSIDSLLEIMKRDVRVQKLFISFLSTLCIDMVDALGMLTLHTAREKTAIFLLNESKRRNSVVLRFNISRQEIADKLAIQKYSLQRTLTEFANDETIMLQGKTITIIDREKLKSIANL